MDLSYGEELESFRKEVQTFLAENWPPKGDGSRDDQTRAFRRTATEAGYLNRHIPKQYGGSEQPPDSMKGAVISEEFAKARAPMEPRGIGTMMLVPTLLERGEEWMKEKWVQATIEGDVAWCQGCLLYTSPSPRD